MSEYELVVVPDTVDSFCEDCIFFDKDQVSDFRGSCSNEYTVKTDTGHRVSKTFVPPCMTPPVEHHDKRYSVIYRLAHKVSGALLSDADCIELVNHYKQGIEPS